MKKFFLPLMSLFLLASCKDNPTQPETPATNTDTNASVIEYSITNTYPHDSKLFTEGFLFNNGQLFESTGSPESLPELSSVIGIHDLKTGKFSKKIELDKNKYFGEGIAILNNKIYQLTYTTQQGFIYDANSFKKIGEFKFENKEGWGMTSDGQSLIMTDGSNRLTYWDATSLKPTKTLAVSDNGMLVQYLNELEFIKGYIYANVWMSNIIVKIDPSNGHVVGKLDLSSIAMDVKSKYPEVDVLNGIAYDASQDKIYITGKLWPNIYEISFKH